MPVKQNEQAAGNGGGDAVSAEYLNIQLSEIVIDAQIRSEIDIEGESFQSLKASIRDWNVMVPIILMRMEKGYRLIAGERRLRACRELGLPTIPARILDMEGNREEILRIQLTENLQRADLEPIDEANAYVNYFTACHDSLDQEEINNVLVLYQRDPKRVVPEIVATVDTIVNIYGKSAS
jgi:ParB/RepB/Spo0J family partition protein